MATFREMVGRWVHFEEKGVQKGTFRAKNNKNEVFVSTKSIFFLFKNLHILPNVSISQFHKIITKFSSRKRA